MDVWPYRPMLGCTETLEWKTDILGSRTGEQRLALRTAPRQSFDYTARLQETAFSRAKQFARRTGASPVYVPVWGEDVYIGSVPSDATSLTFDTTAGDFRAGGSVLLWQDNETYTLAEIDDVSDTGVTLTGAVGIALAHASVIPVRTALTIGGFSVDRQAVYSDVQAKFLVSDNIDLAADWLSDYPQYQALDIVTDQPVLVSSVSESIVRAVDYIDNGFGPVVPETLRAYVDYGQTVSFLEARGTALWRRRLWLHSLRGKQKPFWLPSFNADMVLHASIGPAATTITVATIGPVADYAGRHIMITTKAGVRYARQITGVVSLGGGLDQLTISSALGVAVAAADVKEVSFLAQMRLNSDTVTIEHRYVLESVVSIPVIEVPA